MTQTVFTDQSNVRPLVSDHQAARVNVENWHEAADRLTDLDARAAAHAVARTDGGKALLEGLFSNSPYLARLALRDIAFATRLLVDGPDAAIEGAWRAIAAIDPGAVSVDALMKALRVLKRHVALATAVADVTRTWPLDRITGTLSDLADLAIDFAWRHAIATTVASGKLPASPSATPTDPLAGSGVIVLAMGKLGAGELNYSSDIDLIVFFDDETPAYRGVDELQRLFVRMTQLMVRILEERTPDGYVFRTDLRLRPDASATPIAVSTSAAEAYYESIGQNWERAAMIKARAVGCDQIAAAGFLSRIAPFVWRKHLDFAAIQDIHSIKRQIAAHKGGTRIEVEGHNLKLGRGGIREIEFFVQTQQLIWGGRDPRLRHRRTADGMAALVDAGRVKPEVARVLLGAYAFLRTLEHRVQMIADQQTHQLPDSEKGLRALAAFLGNPDVDAFRREVVHQLSTVAHHYGQLFEESAPLSAGNGVGSLVFTGVESDPETLATIEGLGFSDPEQVSSRVRAWHHGRYRATRSERARQILTELMPALLQTFGETPQPDEAFRRFDRFLERLPSGVQLFSLFHANPLLLRRIAEVMGMAPSLATHLSTVPTLVEGLLTHDLAEPIGDAGALLGELERQLAVARDYENVLDVTRRWINDRRFQLGVQIIQGLTDPESTGRALSDIVDTAIRCLLPRVEEEFARRHGRVPGTEMPSIAVLALGKLGGQEMSFGSDLDLVFLYDAPITLESDGEKPLPAQTYFMRLCQRLLAALTVKTAEGELFQVDMRLRPTGNKGPIATSLEGFEKYHAESAWTWERMALTRARVIIAGPRLGERFLALRRDILATPRDADALLADVASMRQRIAATHKAAAPWAIKYWPGGLVDCEFVAQYLALRTAPGSPDVPRANTTEAYQALAAAGALSDADAEILTAAVRLWRNIQGLLRLTVDDAFDPETAPDSLKTRLAQVGGAVDFAALETNIAAMSEAARSVYDRVIAEPAARLAPRDPNPQGDFEP